MKKRTLPILLGALAVAVCLAVVPLLPVTANAQTTAEWNVISGTAEQSSDSYGTVFTSDGDYAIASKKAVWADKFGLAFRINRDSKGEVELVISPTEQACPQNSGIRIKAEAVSDDLLESRITLTANGAELEKFDSNMFNWTDGKSYDTNYLYLAKRDSGWVINCNDNVTALSANTSAALDTALTSYKDKIGYLQFGASAKTKFTYVGVQYGMPRQSVENPDGFGYVIFDAPRWTETYGDEICGYSADFGKQYAITSDLPMPLNGLNLKVRAAHGDKGMRFIMAFTSLYSHNWYAGTYTVALLVEYNPSSADGATSISFMMYDEQTDAKHEEPIRITERTDKFKWFESNEISIKKVKGIWQFDINGSEAFAGKISSDGLTVNDYLNIVAPYYIGGNAYYQMFAPDSGGGVGNDGYVIESVKVQKTNNAPELQREVVENLGKTQFKVGDTVSVNLNQLFTDADGDKLTFFATKGNIDNGVWTYKPITQEQIFVTFSATDGSAEQQTRIEFDIAAAASADGKKGGCSSSVGYASAAASVLILLAALLAVKKGRKNNEKIG